MNNDHNQKKQLQQSDIGFQSQSPDASELDEIPNMSNEFQKNLSDNNIQSIPIQNMQVLATHNIQQQQQHYQQHQQPNESIDSLLMSVNQDNANFSQFNKVIEPVTDSELVDNVGINHFGETEYEEESMAIMTSQKTDHMLKNETMHGKTNQFQTFKLNPLQGESALILENQSQENLNYLSEIDENLKSKTPKSLAYFNKICNENPDIIIDIIGSNDILQLVINFLTEYLLEEPEQAQSISELFIYFIRNVGLPFLKMWNQKIAFFEKLQQLKEQNSLTQEAIQNIELIFVKAMKRITPFIGLYNEQNNNNNNFFCDFSNIIQHFNFQNFKQHLNSFANEQMPQLQVLQLNNKANSVQNQTNCDKTYIKNLQEMKNFTNMYPNLNRIQDQQIACKALTEIIGIENLVLGTFYQYNNMEKYLHKSLLKQISNIKQALFLKFPNLQEMIQQSQPQQQNFNEQPSNNIQQYDSIAQAFQIEQSKELWERDFFIIGENLGLHESRTVEFKGFQSYEYMIKNKYIELKDTINSFLNSQGGRLYIGVHDYKAVVKGIDINYKMRDKIVNLFTQEFASQYEPRPSYDKIQVVFLQVVKRNNQPIPGLFVIKVIVRGPQIITVDGRDFNDMCFIKEQNFEKIKTFRVCYRTQGSVNNPDAAMIFNIMRKAPAPDLKFEFNDKLQENLPKLIDKPEEQKWIKQNKSKQQNASQQQSLIQIQPQQIRRQMIIKHKQNKQNKSLKDTSHFIIQQFKAYTPPIEFSYKTEKNMLEDSILVIEFDNKDYLLAEKILRNARTQYPYYDIIMQGDSQLSHQTEIPLQNVKSMHFVQQNSNQVNHQVTQNQCFNVNSRNNAQQNSNPVSLQSSQSQYQNINYNRPNVYQNLTHVNTCVAQNQGFNVNSRHNVQQNSNSVSTQSSQSQYQNVNYNRPNLKQNLNPINHQAKQNQQLNENYGHNVQQNFPVKTWASQNQQLNANSYHNLQQNSNTVHLQTTQNQFLNANSSHNVQQNFNVCASQSQYQNANYNRSNVQQNSNPVNHQVTQNQFLNANSSEVNKQLKQRNQQSDKQLLNQNMLGLQNFPSNSAKSSNFQPPNQIPKQKQSRSFSENQNAMLKKIQDLKEKLKNQPEDVQRQQLGVELQPYVIAITSEQDAFNIISKLIEAHRFKISDIYEMIINHQLLKKNVTDVMKQT